MMFNKLKTSYLIFFLLLQLSNISFASDTTELKFKDVFKIMKSCIEKYDFKEVNSSKFYDRTEKFADFNFGNLLPTKKNINESDYFKIYYKNDKIVRVSRINKKNIRLNYSFLVLNDENFCFLIFAKNYKKDKEKFTLENKVIIHNKKNNENVILYVMDLFSSDIDNNNDEYYLLNSKVNTKDIVLMYYLDNKLNAETRLNFHNDKPFSFSKILKKDGIYYEKLENYVIHKEYGNLNYVSYKFLVDYIKHGSSVHEALYNMTVKPNQSKGFPLWFTHSRYF